MNPFLKNKQQVHEPELPLLYVEYSNNQIRLWKMFGFGLFIAKGLVWKLETWWAGFFTPIVEQNNSDIYSLTSHTQIKL